MISFIFHRLEKIVEPGSFTQCFDDYIRKSGIELILTIMQITNEKEHPWLFTYEKLNLWIQKALKEKEIKRMRVGIKVKNDHNMLQKLGFSF